jgi:hypothetical protein
MIILHGMNLHWDWEKLRRSLNIFFPSHLFYCGANNVLNLCIVRGENPPVIWTKKVHQLL